jgi:predicted nucleotidyltransferase
MMEPSFEKLLALLAESEVRFVVVGGIAVTLHGYVRLTEDVDLLVAADTPNLERLLEALKHFGEGFAAELATTDFDDSEGAIRVVEETESCHIDLFTRMSGKRYEDVIEDAETFMLRGLPVRYASKAALIAWKEKSIREKDKLDAMALRKLQANPRAFD